MFPKEHYLNASHGLKSWLLTTDHKRICLLYLFGVSLFFTIGAFYAGLVRAELITPGPDLLTPDAYNRAFTMHAVMMIFFFLIPSIPGTLGNFLIPLMIGAKDVAFPKLNLASWYMYMGGASLALFAMFTGGVDTGWTFYTPFSTTYSNTYVTTVAIGVFLNGFSSIFTGLNFLVTIHRMRAPGMTWFRLPLFIWSHYATSLIMVLGTPVVAITLLLVGLERMFKLGFFDPALGGDPVLFQHMFWFYSHPAVYIMILPSMGVISEIIAAFARKPVFGYKLIAFSSLGIAIIGFLVWGHHLFVVRPVGLRRHHLLVPHHAGGGAVGDQGVQLGGHPLRGLDRLRDADVLRPRLPRPLHHRRPDRRDARHDGPRHPPARHLLRGGALPLHHGGRRALRVPRRHPLLVAEDLRPHGARLLDPAVGPDGVRRLQPDLLPAVHPRLHGHAAPVPRATPRSSRCCT